MGFTIYGNGGHLGHVTRTVESDHISTLKPDPGDRTLHFQFINVADVRTY